MKFNSLHVTLALGVALAVSAQAQTMEETAAKLGTAAGKAYFAPIVSAFGSNLNGGWYHKAPPAKKFGFHVEAGAIMMGTLLSGGSKTFSTTGAFRLDSASAAGVASEFDTTGFHGLGQRYRDSIASAIRRTDINVRFEGPTIIGSKDESLRYTVATDPLVIGKPGGDTTITLPASQDTINGASGLIDLALLPIAAPQITVGTLFGTNVTVRWLPEIQTTDEIGKVKFFGFGIQHNPGVWFNSGLPVDLGLSYFTQSLSVGTLFKAQTQAVGINVSKTLGWRFLNLTPYGGFQLEKSTFDFKYVRTVDEEEIPIKFSLEGDNKYRATAGLSVRLLAINLNADYNVGKYNSFTAGVMIGI
jgi:hypothetical protein